MCIASFYARRIDILDNPRRNVDCGVRLGEWKVPSPRALSTLSTRSHHIYCDVYISDSCSPASSSRNLIPAEGRVLVR